MAFQDMAFRGDRARIRIARSENRLKRVESLNSISTRRGGIALVDPTNRATFSTYALDKDPLSATDAGSSATINIASFRIFWEDRPSEGVDYRDDSIPKLAYATKYAVYVDNPERDGLSMGYEATRAGQEIVVRQESEGRFHLGTITTPAAAAGDTSGDSNGGGGTGSGGIVPLDLRQTV